MSAIGSLIFCSECGNLLESTTAQWTTCDQCQSVYPSEQFANLVVETKSSASAFPSALKLKHSIVQVESQKEEAATVCNLFLSILFESFFSCWLSFFFPFRLCIIWKTFFFLRMH